MRYPLATRATAPSAVSSAALTHCVRAGLVMHTSKSDVQLDRFTFNEQYTEFRNRSGRVPDHSIDRYRATYWRVDEYVRRSENYIRAQGFFFLPALEFPWYKGCLPLLSSYQIRVLYIRHHRAYVDRLNQLIEGTSLYGMKLDELIAKSAHDSELTAVYNNAAQHYNLSFFWKCIQPYGSNIPPDLATAVADQYGSVEAFQSCFTTAALNLFGSGWVYWVYNTKMQAFDVVSLSNAGCPLAEHDMVPLLCVNVWECAYYIDYENNRAKYLAGFFQVVDWHWAERHWKRATGQPYEEMKFW